MKARMLVLTIVAAAVLGASVPTRAVPAAYASVDRSAYALLVTPGAFGFVWASSPAVDPGTVCAELYVRAARRVDYGCGEADIAIDPILRTARISGSIESTVYGVESDEDGTRSMLVIDVTLEGAGDVSHGAWQYAESYQTYASGYAGVVAWRDAGGTGRLESTSVCTGVRRSCVPALSAPVEEGGMAAWAEGYAATESFDECGDKQALQAMLQRLGLPGDQPQTAC